ncbi:DUF3363 domain-containing protein [Paremcibacter congregatus]|uniref:DUF3363 domain-containing protein n=1 Tax=Paremcibacter congregatus TaxID=2043170 RepID=UPI0013FDC1B7|nr:DUF3363 domain-containing protein [Paremcibacter congregatus]
MIKARFVKLAGTGFGKASSHLRYVQRDGVSKENEEGKLYNADHDEIDGEKFLDQAKEDRHQFRFIVSPEDAVELDNMKIFTRDLMLQMEKDLSAKLDWVAVDHYNTDNPHTHIILRGVDDQGQGQSQDLIIARDYLSHGLRTRACNLMTDELGPRQDHEIENTLRREVRQDRFTSIDQGIIRQAENSIIDLRIDGVEDGSRMSRRGFDLSRLKKLQTMGLAEEVGPLRWRLSKDMESTLRDLGQRGDIIKMMHAEMKRQKRDPLRTAYEIFRPAEQPDKVITGKLAAKGLSDEFNDRYYLVVEGIDGKTHYADIGQQNDIGEYKTGSIVELKDKSVHPRKTDQSIVNIAEENNGLYSAEYHAFHDPGASKEFIRAHVRRLEALRRVNIVRRFTDGSWKIPDGYLDDVTDHERKHASRSPVATTIRSRFSLDVQVSATGATWLDNTLLDQKKFHLSNVGFGAEVDNALKQRRAYLMAEGFARETVQGITYQRDLLKRLEQRELSKVAVTIAEETGKAFRRVCKGDQIEGTYTKPVDLVSAKYAVIENSKEFTLVPWRSVLERARGQSVSGGINSRGGVSWNIGKKRGMGIS